MHGCHAIQSSNATTIFSAYLSSVTLLFTDIFSRFNTMNPKFKETCDHALYCTR